MDEKDQNPKAQPFTFRIESLRIFLKVDFFGENPKQLKIRYLEIRCIFKKGPPGTLNGPIGPIFLDRSQDKPQT